jgi:hypothetical protein
LGKQRCIPSETKDWRPVQDELIKDALEFVLDKRNLPCLVMDQSVPRRNWWWQRTLSSFSVACPLCNQIRSARDWNLGRLPPSTRAVESQRRFGRSETRGRLRARAHSDDS